VNPNLHDRRRAKGHRIGADVIMRARRWTALQRRPGQTPGEKIDNISYIDVIKQDLKVMDATASLCMDNSLPLVVFDIKKSDNIRNICSGRKIGSTVVRCEH
jgi:uridylate kinase